MLCSLFQNEEEKLWISKLVEESTEFSLSSEEKKHFAKLLIKAKVIIVCLLCGIKLHISPTLNLVTPLFNPPI